MGENSSGYHLVVRPYAEEDFSLVAGWWRKHHGNDFRPGYPSKTAYVIEYNNIPLGFFSMHPMDCDFCYLGFPLVNPEAPKLVREKVVDYIIDCAKIWAEKAGFPIVWISIRGEKILNRLRDKGFVVGEEGNTHMFCKIGEIK